ncbi:MAG: activator of HSP90 ATPase 1 family protein [Lewinellaceae bacterium]|nr:activator of HSP90 ATPase 1 family protein [Lewinellaceae bacterium]
MERTKIELEYIFRASPTIVYNFLTTPACLVRWFCDSVDINGVTYSFVWDNFAEVATLSEDIEEERVHFEWEDKEEGEFLEFRISTSPITGETILEITDFCDSDEVSDYKKLWESQIRDLRKEMGDA